MVNSTTSSSLSTITPVDPAISFSRSYESSQDLVDTLTSGPFGKGATVEGQGRIVKVNTLAIPETMEFTTLLEQLKDPRQFPMTLHFRASAPSRDEFAEEKKTEDPRSVSPVPQHAPLTSPDSASFSELPPPTTEFTIFVQSSTGAFFPATEITNASVVAVRRSVVAGLPPGTTVQWYRETEANQWVPLAGATRPLFQPTAVDAGCRLHCRIQSSATVVVTLPTVSVQAASNLWNAARHTATAAFGLQGRGPAMGRNVRVAVERDGRLTFHQQQGADSVPLAPGPVALRTAVACYTQGKELSLHLAGIPQDCLLSALCDSDKVLSLRAPNRMARESLLLAIGIANFEGGELDETVQLFGREFCGADEAVPITEGSDELVVEDEPDEKEPVDELTALREKLARKDKIIAELQRQLAESDSAVRSVEATVQEKENDLVAERDLHAATKQSVSKLERRVEVIQAERNRISSVHSKEIRELQSQLQSQFQQASIALKAQKALQNEKNVLTATVEARDGKLQRMAQLQAQLEATQEQVAQLQHVQEEHAQCQKKLADAKQQVERVVAARVAAETAKQQLEADVHAAKARLQKQESLSLACQTKMENEQLILQKLKAERNSYKQRVDSLAKEMNRICANGRTVRHVEKVLADDKARQEEVAVLREQKRRALADLEHFRQAYEQSIGISKMAGLDTDSIKVLERNAELERLLSEMAEYVDAKEMQLETMKQVNTTLQTELRELAQATQTSGDV